MNLIPGWFPPPDMQERLRTLTRKTMAVKGYGDGQATMPVAVQPRPGDVMFAWMGVEVGTGVNPMPSGFTNLEFQTHGNWAMSWSYRICNGNEGLTLGASGQISIGNWVGGHVLVGGNDKILSVGSPQALVWDQTSGNPGTATLNLSAVTGPVVGLGVFFSSSGVAGSASNGWDLTQFDGQRMVMGVTLLDANETGGIQDVDTDDGGSTNLTTVLYTRLS